MAGRLSAPPRVRGLAPVADAGARTLILGSMPSVASLAARQYYGHPRNAFWDVLGAIGIERALPYPERTAALRACGVALWDVLAECTRPGSLDAAIRDPVPNDLATFVGRHAALRRIWFNGRAARQLFERHARESLARAIDARPIELRLLPSTSPAHASRAKFAIWRDALRGALEADRD